MRLFHLELEREPALAIELHPRLTVLAVEPTLRARLVDALDGLLRGRASELRGALGAEGMRAEFMVESPSGPVLPGVPTIVREGDIDVSADANAPSATERAASAARSVSLAAWIPSGEQRSSRSAPRSP